VLQFLEKDEIIVDLQRQIEALEQKVEGAEQQKSLQQEAWERQETELRKEIDQLRDRLDDKQNVASENSDEVEKLRAQVETLETQVAEFKKEEVDFKVALVAAQRFADDVRKKAREEADAMLEQAIDEVETFRRESEKELARLPVEIDTLQKQKEQVREDLKAVLITYLEQLDGTPAPSAPDIDDDLSQLFQSIPLGGDEEIEPADADIFEAK
jgi:chromosome segregation ATPase